jgi:hypothetical protein|tara:strand:+ start:11786 stop:12235 length:450 start_codon:yes stop_codon:yes gene_type:complete
MPDELGTPLEIEPIDDDEQPKGIPTPEQEKEEGEPPWRERYLEWRKGSDGGMWRVEDTLRGPEIMLDGTRLSDILGYSIPNDKLTAFIEENDIQGESEFGFMEDDLMLKVGDSWKNIFDIIGERPLSKGGRYRWKVLAQADEKKKTVLK